MIFHHGNARLTRSDHACFGNGCQRLVTNLFGQPTCLQAWDPHGLQRLPDQEPFPTGMLKVAPIQVNKIALDRISKS